MSEYNIQMNKYNALNAGYDQLYPATKIENVDGLNTALQNKAPAGYGYDGANSSLLLLNFISGDTVDDKLTTLFNSMTDESAVQICLSDTSFSGYEMHGTLYKLSNYHGGYATAVFNGYDNYAGIPVTVRKVLREGVWGPYEYFTPPMYIGVEYRTTERYQGKPVYVKAINFGELPSTGWRHVDIDNQNRARAIRVSGLLNNGTTIPGTDESQTDGSKPLQCYGYNNNVCIYAPYDASSKTAVVTAWYTKTTD